MLNGIWQAEKDSGAGCLQGQLALKHMRGKMKRKINQQTNKKIRSSSFQKYPVALEASDKPVKAKAWVRIAYIHACACARVCTYVCTCMHIYIYIVCSFIQIYVVAYTDIGLLHTYTCMYVWMDVRAYVCMYGYVRNCDSMCTCTCMYNVCVCVILLDRSVYGARRKETRAYTYLYLPAYSRYSILNASARFDAPHTGMGLFATRSSACCQ